MFCHLALSCVAALLLGAAPPLSPTAVLARYDAELARVATPSILEFEFAVEQVGPRNLDQTHRVYRSGLTERDETLSVSGVRLRLPSVRIIRNRLDRYSILEVAPRVTAYTFAFVRLERVGTRQDYVFRTEPHLSSAFTVREITLDGSTFLPTVVHFSTSMGGDRSEGKLTFGKFDRYWLVREATLNATVSKKPVRERIVWSRYRFPPSLPASTFAFPRPVLRVPAR